MHERCDVKVHKENQQILQKEAGQHAQANPDNTAPSSHNEPLLQRIQIVHLLQLHGRKNIIFTSILGPWRILYQKMAISKKILSQPADTSKTLVL